MCIRDRVETEIEDASYIVECLEKTVRENYAHILNRDLDVYKRQACKPKQLTVCKQNLIIFFICSVNNESSRQIINNILHCKTKLCATLYLITLTICHAEQEDGRILRSLKFRFPVFFNEQELYELDWDNESTVESVLLMRRAKR